jgi:hypothetical protein
MRLTSAITLTLLLSGAGVGYSQQPCPLGHGVTVNSRIRTDCLEGRVVDCDDDSLVLATGRGAGRRVVPYEAIEKLKVQHGRERAGGKGAAIGAISLLFGLMYGGQLGCLSDTCDARSVSGGAAAIMGGGIVGGLLGLGVGSAFHQDRWERVDLSRPRHAATPGRKGIALNLSICF